MASASETCSCGASFGFQGWFGAKRAVQQWRERHECLGGMTGEPQRDSQFFAQVERSEDYTLPELHIGFRAE